MNWDRINERYYRAIRSEHDTAFVRQRVHWMVKQCRGRRVLDIGCSQGIVSLLAAREGYEVVGIDIETEAISYAKDELKKESQLVRDRVIFELFDAGYELVNHFGSFDCILLGEVLEHLAHPSRILISAWKALHDKGRLIITVPYGIMEFHDHKNYFQISSLLDLIKDRFQVESLEIKSGFLLVTGEKVSNAIQLSETFWHDKLTISEAAYISLQKEAAHKESKLKNTILELRNQKEDLKSNFSNFKAQFNEISQDIPSKIVRRLAVELQQEIKTLRESLKTLEREHAGTLLAGARLGLFEKYKKLRDILGNKIKSFHKKVILKNIKIEELQQEIKTHRQRSKSLEREHAETLLAGDHLRLQIETIESDTILFFPTNGAGLGHLNRSIAIARELDKLAPERKTLFFTTSTALSILQSHGYLAYHLPSVAHFSKRISVAAWNGLLKNRLLEIFKTHSPSALVFDGASVYAGMMKALSFAPHIKKIWIKRELYRSSEIRNKIQKRVEDFDMVIIPGEIGDALQNETGLNNCMKVNPIIYGDPSRILSRNEACNLLGIDPKMKTIYVQLGAGNINSLYSLLSQIFKTLREIKDIQVVFAESPISQMRSRPSGNYLLLKNYPNIEYVNAFDLGVMAAGYNSVHEALYYGLPTIFFPNNDTKADDQMERAKRAAAHGNAAVLEEFDSGRFKELVISFLEKEKPKISSFPTNGAVQAAEAIASMLDLAQLDPT